MTDDVARWPQGDREIPSHVALVSKVGFAETLQRNSVRLVVGFASGGANQTAPIGSYSIPARPDFTRKLARAEVVRATLGIQEEVTVPTRKSLETLRSAEEHMKSAEEKLRSFIERPNRQYSPDESAENKRLLDDLRLAMVEYSEAFERAVRS